MSSEGRDSIDRKPSDIDLGKATAEFITTVKRFAADYEVVRRFQEVKTYIISRTEKRRRFLSDQFERVRPMLWEVLVFMFTWSGPPLFLTIFYLSTCLIMFSRYLSKRLNKPETPSVNRALAIICKMWTNITRYYYDHEIKGLEKIPSNSSAILVWYHGVVPIDYIALVSQLYLRDGRMVHSVVDRFLPSIPGWDLLERDLKLTAAGKGYLVDLLENGEIMGVAVGGAREALFDWDYSVDWGTRNGFSKVALLTGAPVIPIFTENIREAFTTMQTGGSIWRSLYENTRLPMVPIYGGFPVKLTTHIGDPIRPGGDETADQLKERVQTAMREMVDTHQVKQGGASRAVLARLGDKLSLIEKLA